MKFSKRAMKIKASAIRELLKLTQRADIISFGGGLPAPESFPVSVIQKICKKVLKERGPQSLQYGPTEGLDPLRKEVVKEVKRRGINAKLDEVVITTGSQQVLNIMAEIFIDEGDYIVVESPTYLGALSGFNGYMPRYLTVPMDENGMKTEILEEKLKKKRKRVKFIYTVPTFQNPAGITMNLKRRKHLLNISEKYKIPILEDDAYYDLRYSGKNIKPIKGMDKKGNVIYTGTFSKVLSPGFRLGYIIGDKKTIRKFVIAKQGVDLCTNVFVQNIAYEYLKSGSIRKQIPKIRRIYKKKRDIMLKALKKHFPKEAKWTRPDGGMFIWVTLPKKINAKKIFKEAIKEKVAYVPGEAFFADGKGQNTMRLNFSNADDKKIEIGIKRLAKIIKKKLR